MRLLFLLVGLLSTLLFAKLHFHGPRYADDSFRSCPTEWLYSDASVPQVLCLGDSLTEGYGSEHPAVDNYPSQLRAMLHRSLVVNAGVSSQTLADIMLNLERQVDARLCPISSRRTAVVWAGTNDVFAGASGELAFKRLVKLCGLLRARGMKVEVVTIIPRTGRNVPPDFAARASEFNSRVMSEWPRFADGVYDAANDPALTASDYSDGTHLRRSGYAKIAAGVRASLLRLESLSQPSPQFGAAEAANTFP